MQVSLQYAQEHFADIVSAANRGEEVEIAQPDKPALKLFLIAPVAERSRKGRRILGAGVGEMRVPSWEEWKAMDEELEAVMTKDIFPPPYSEEETLTSRASLLGSGKGKIWLAEDWDSEQTNQEIADLFNNSALFPEDQAK